MKADEFRTLMHREQKEDFAVEECIEIINTFEPTEDKTTFSLDGFTEFVMFSDWQVIFSENI